MAERSEARDRLRVGVVKWSRNDELAGALAEEMERLGHCPLFFPAQGPLPEGADAILTFAPYGPFLPIAQRVGKQPVEGRPVLAHWNFEGYPNPQLPWALIYSISAARSGLERLPPRVANRPPLGWLQSRMYRWRYLGDYFYAYHKGWLGVLATISDIQAGILTEHGLATQFVPWGTSPRWYATLPLERDIDVLWFGKRRNARRGELIDRVRADVEAHGYRMVVVDGVEHPFIFGVQRTEFLNRTKIALNVKTLAHSDEFVFRFHMAAGNRALVVSEDFIRSAPQYEPGVHYASSAPERLAETVLYYLGHPDERRAIAENAYNLVTQEMTLGHSTAALMTHVLRARESARR